MRWRMSATFSGEKSSHLGNAVFSAEIGNANRLIKLSNLEGEDWKADMESLVEMAKCVQKIGVLSEAGIDVVTDIEEGIFGLIISNDQELNFKKLEDACKLLLGDIEYIATNPDWVCPTIFGYVPDCGSFAEMLFRATGKKPHFIGKPRPEMLTLAMGKYGYSKEESVMIGDRVYTDIASGYNAEIDTIFVLTGEGTMSDAENTDTKPTYIFKNIKEVLKCIE